MGDSPSRHGRGTGGVRAVLLAAAAILLLAGCATRVPRSPRAPRRLALSPAPAVPAATLSDADAVLAAFFAAYGIDLPPEERADILPDGVVQGRLDRAALLRAARKRNRIAATLKADPDGLREAFGRNRPLLLYLPGGRHGSVRLAMPADWDPESGRIGLVVGDGPLLEIPADRFFGMRDALAHSALCLSTPRGLDRLPIPGTERTRLLADYHAARGDNRRAAALYGRLLADAAAPELAVHALCGRADSLVRMGEPGKAIPLYRQALELDPENPRLHNNLACALLQAGIDPAGALDHADTACRIAPSNPFYLETAGAARIAAGDCDTAAATLERAWSRARDRAPDVQAAICDQLARAWLCAGRPDLARQVASHRAAAWPDIPFPGDLADALPDLARP